MSGENPADSHELFDSIVFDGVRSPGIVTVSGFEREQNLDVKESDGQKGATTTWKGEKVAKGTLSFYLVRNDDVNEFELWDAFAALWWATVPPKSGKKPVAKDVYHPDLARNHVTSLILSKMGKIVHDGRGGAAVTIDASEYYPPKPAAAGGASGSKPKTDPNDPISQATAELNNLLNTASKP